MFLGHLERLVDAFLDRHRGHHDDEFREAILPVQFKDRTQVDVGFAGAGLHLDREVHALGKVFDRWLDVVLLLDGLDVIGDMVDDWFSAPHKKPAELSIVSQKP